MGLFTIIYLHFTVQFYTFAINLVELHRYLFWSDWDANAPRIERCSMSGTHRKRVLRVDQITDGAWPNGLTLDYVLRRIYWIDARYISC